MGVNEQLIIMIGCDVGYDTYNQAGGFDKFEKLDIVEEGKENVGRIAVISDGMSGDYCMVGIPIYVSGRYEHFSDLSNNKKHKGLGMKGLIPPTEEQIKDYIRALEEGMKYIKGQEKK